MRIRGTIGDWPVDLTIELNEQELQQLTGALPGNAVKPSVSTGRTQDATWLQAQKLLRDQGEVDGPGLMLQLVELAGSEGAAKRLLMQLRHCEQVRVSGSNGDRVTYHWIAER